ncbi:MAG: GntR family transcriptional regulator [Pseudomonadota bacterium]
MIVQNKETCRQDLIERILTLDIEPGAVLDEAELSEMYGLSRTPLREVFQKLAGEGYLTLAKNRGTKVSSMDINSMRNFFQAAPMIYAAVARLAAENAKKEQIAEIKEVQRLFRMACEQKEIRLIVMHNHNFHELIGKMADNPFLTPSLNRLLIDHSRMSQKFYSPINSKERLVVWKACDQHDAMIEALEKGEPATIVELTLEHWALSRDEIEKYSRPDPLDINLGKTG